MDSVMLMSHIRGGAEGRDVHGRDIHSAFNSINPEIMFSLITDEDLKRWIKNFLAPRTLQIKTTW